MRVLTQTAFGGPDVLHVTERQDPTAGPNEVVVTTTAIGVNPVDAVVRSGAFPLLGDPPFVLGWDIAGTIASVGSGVTKFQVGDRVFGMPRFPAQAAGYAEQVVAPADELTRTPEILDDLHAAALPLVSLTAYQALTAFGPLPPGSRVLVHAAGGGVGHVAVQIAKAQGAFVVATVSPGKAAFVRALGADEIIDYTATDFTTTEPVDLAIDSLGGANTARTLQVVRPGGVLALLVGAFDDTTSHLADLRGVRLTRISVTPDEFALTAIADLVRTRQLTPFLTAALPFADAGKAHTLLDGGTRGKVVLTT